MNFTNPDKNQKKIALITGISGQDGYYCADLLTSLGYEVIGTTRNVSCFVENHLHAYPKNIQIVEWNLKDQQQLEKILLKYRPSEIYNFAGLTSGSELFSDPTGMVEINGLAVLKILHVIHAINPDIKLCQASSSEIFSRTQGSPQIESSPRDSKSPYGAAKILADSAVKIYRDNWGLFACSAILYNHESPRRSPDFVSRKITMGAAKIKNGLATELVLGNIDLCRDWSFAGDAVKAMWMMLQQSKPDDYIVSSSNPHTPREFCELAFNHLGLNYSDFVRISSEHIRQIDSSHLIGNNSKIKSIGWHPKVSFTDLVTMMLDNDLSNISKSNLKDNYFF